MSILRRSAALLAAISAFASTPLPAQPGGGAEERTARYLDAVRDRPPLLYAFLREMPKGADLHSHLSGAVYAESYLRWAAEDGLCVAVRELSLAYPPCNAAGDTIAAAQAVSNGALYGELIDAFSMRNWNAARENGHDQFFNTFGKFGAIDRRTGDMLAEAAHRAAAGGVSYLELMLTADGRGATSLGASVGWDPDFAAMRQKLLAAGLRDTVAKARGNLTRVEARRDTVLRCGATGADAGCGVTVRWLYQVARGRAPQQVFAQILTGFELASDDERVVGFNLVQPEDALVPMRDYTLHMQMIDFLHRLYPHVKVTLHAGELAPGLVPPEGLRFHVRQAVELGHASRIGHGVDVLYEDRPDELLREMARRGVMVEIALTSNDVILGVRGKDHPLAAYLAAGVPVALATDDEGVSRSEMTLEYRKAVLEQGLGYATLKAMARNSLHHAFIRGESLWADPRAFTPVPDCAGGMDSARCRAYVDRSAKARLQADQERAFAAFEARYAAMEPPVGR